MPNKGKAPGPSPHSRGRFEVVARLLNVSKFFDSLWNGDFVWALRNVTFEVRRGEVLGLLGPSGSGKSTALQMLAGKLRPVEGKVEVFGRSPRSRWAKARIGYLPQRADASTRFERSSLRGLFNRLLGISSGQSLPAGVGFMHALRNKPDLILLDDPFDAVNTTANLAIREKIRALAQNGRTIVVTSSLLSEVHGLCDRLAVFSAGTVMALGTVNELLADAHALNFLAPVLPQTLSRRLREMIRESLSEPPSRESASSALLPPDSVPATPPVTQIRQVADSQQPANKALNGIDYQRLDELTRGAD
jgi:ABC-type multidrug transport system ATPase subunit